MTEETIVAMYDTPAHAQAAIRDLKAANVPHDAIGSHAGDSAAGGTAATSDRDPGFWSSIFGGESTDAAVYDDSLANGSTVVTVKVPEQHKSRVAAILEQHDPIDFDARAASYGKTRTTTTTATVSQPTAAASQAVAKPMTTTADDDTIKVVEERLTVGKRAVNNGGARVRSYVVEVPVEEQVSLHSETVRIERHPVTDGAVVTAADFTDKVIEMTETNEEAVVGKTARVVEEISLHKDAADRVETVRDTVRQTKVDVEEVPVTETVSTKVATTPARPKI